MNTTHHEISNLQKIEKKNVDFTFFTTSLFHFTLLEGAHPTLRFAHRDMHPPHHLHHMACVMSVVIAVKSTVVVKSALFELHVHAILHSYMLMTCGLLHAIHAHAHA